MSIYGGIQLPRISENSLDEKKERKQILNYLALLDEKLRYMFQNIDIEENLSEDSKELFFKYGEDISNVIKDTEGKFSLFQQEINNITLQVQSAEGSIASLQITADGLASRVSANETGISELVQTATSIKSTVRSLQDDVDDAYSMAEQAEDHFSWIVESGNNASSMTLTDSFLEVIADEVKIDATVKLADLMEVYEDDSYEDVGGYIGYGEGYNGKSNTYGIIMSNYDEDCYVIATDYGVRMTYNNQNAVHCTSKGVTMVADEYEIIMDDSYGNLCPGEDDEQLLGEEDYRWQGLYAENDTIQTSDRTKKYAIEYDMEKYEKFFTLLKPTQYKMINGDSGRYHTGFISQDVEEALTEAGLSSLDFAGFIKSPLYKRDEDRKKLIEEGIIGYAYSLRYGEFAALNTHMIQKLMKRVSDLESKLEALG